MGDYILTTNGKLYHHGIRGMKWGVRRYQNKDGSLTAAGKKRRDREFNALNKDQQKNFTENPNKWVQDDLRRSKGVADSSSNMIRELKRVNDTSIRNKSKTRMNLDNMTDEQMRKEINRALLERQYNDMFAPQKTSKGREYTSKILEGAGTALTITGSALTVALAIRELVKP